MTQALNGLWFVSGEGVQFRILTAYVRVLEEMVETTKHVHHYSLSAILQMVFLHWFWFPIVLPMLDISPSFSSSILCNPPN